MKISIISAVYNAESVIEHCVKSVQEQGDPDYEHLLIDNCSEDKTVEIARRTNPSIRIYSAPDKGIYDAMNKGAALSKGDLLAWLNADDRYLPGTLQAVRVYFSKHPETGVLHGDMMVDGRIVHPPRGIASFGGFRVFHPAVFVRREVFEENGPFDLNFKICADLDFFLRAGENAVRFVHIDRALTDFALGGVSTVFRHKTSREVANVLKKNGKSVIFAEIWHLFMELRAYAAVGKRLLRK